MKEDQCPHRHKHTICPVGYLQWFHWAEKKARRHYQVRCVHCGRWAIWKRRTVNEMDYGIKARGTDK